MLNKVTLIGNLGKDPEVRHLEGGSVVAKFSVATNESYKDKSGEWQTRTEWHNVVAWRMLAERAERDFKKGKLVYVEGKLTNRKWQDKEGNDRYTTEVVANVLKLLEKRESSNPNPMNTITAADDPFNTMSTEANSPASTVMDVKDAPTNTGAQEDDLPF